MDPTITVSLIRIGQESLAMRGAVERYQFTNLAGYGDHVAGRRVVYVIQ
jgi:hypothetical protein